MPRTEPRWLSVEEIIEFNRDVLSATGESHFVRDIALLEGALMRPQSLWHYEEEDDLLNLAVSLLFAIAGAHAFEQGNKRTAYVAFRTFLTINSLELEFFTEKTPISVAIAIEEVITHRMSVDAFTDLIALYADPDYEPDDAADPAEHLARLVLRPSSEPKP